LDPTELGIPINNDQPEVFTVGKLAAGDYFGVNGLLDSKPRTTTVYAATNCHVFIISKKDFDRVMTEHNTRIKNEKQNYLKSLSLFKNLYQSRIKELVPKF
jgi:CRP-like cAMP-binding protein